MRRRCCRSRLRRCLARGYASGSTLHRLACPPSATRLPACGVLCVLCVCVGCVSGVRVCVCLNFQTISTLCSLCCVYVALCNSSMLQFPHNCNTLTTAMSRAAPSIPRSAASAGPHTAQICSLSSKSRSRARRQSGPSTGEREQNNWNSHVHAHANLAKQSSASF